MCIFNGWWLIYIWQNFGNKIHISISLIWNILPNSLLSWWWQVAETGLYLWFWSCNKINLFYINSFYYGVEQIREYWDDLGMWKEWMSTVWSEGCWWPKSIGGRVRGRPRLGWMDGVKVALGNRGMTVEAVRQCTKDRNYFKIIF